MGGTTPISRVKRAVAAQALLALTSPFVRHEFALLLPLQEEGQRPVGNGTGNLQERIRKSTGADKLPEGRRRARAGHTSSRCSVFGVKFKYCYSSTTTVDISRLRQDCCIHLHVRIYSRTNGSNMAGNEEGAGDTTCQ